MLSGNVVSAIRGIGNTIEEGEVSYESLYTDANIDGTLRTAKGAASNSSSALQVSTTGINSTGTLAATGNLSVNTNKFAVTASTGGVVSKGDILLNTNHPAMNVAATYSDSPSQGATGAISLATFLTNLITDGDDDAWTLADGVNGQFKKIVLATDGTGDMVITPANFHDGTTITMGTATGFILLVFMNSKWAMVNSKSVTIA